MALRDIELRAVHEVTSFKGLPATTPPRTHHTHHPQSHLTHHDTTHRMAR